MRPAFVNEINPNILLHLWNCRRYILHIHPQRTYISSANRFLHVLRKKSWNKLCLRPHDTCCLFRIFFSQVNNKQFFSRCAIPLNHCRKLRSVIRKMQILLSCSLIFELSFLCTTDRHSTTGAQQTTTQPLACAQQTTTLYHSCTADQY